MLNTERLCIGCMNDNGGEDVCSICGYNQATPNNEQHLQPRYWLCDRYLIGRVIECNGEGVTYLGWDNISDSIVNIREYFPKGAAERKANGEVNIATGNEYTFNEGLLSFLELNKKLMGFSNLPSMMTITDVFEHAGTAYSIVKAVQGVTLKEFLIRNGGNLEWEQTRSLFLPLITTVAELHEAGIIHRGISPDTILVGRDGKLRLNDFCIRAVRTSNSNMAIQLYPGFSAVEQYGYDLKYRDGKYTDVYGVAATMFRVLMGKNPTEVPERVNNDNMQIPARYAESIPKYVLTALANALQIMPQDRVQDMDSFRIMLTPVSASTITVPKASVVKPQPPKPEPKTVNTQPKSKKKAKSSKNYAVLSSVITALIMIGIAAILFFALDLGAPQDSGSTNSPSIESSSELPPPPPESSVGSDIGEKLYQVPKVVGKKYVDVVNNTDYKDLFGFEISSKVYSDKVEEGKIVSQEQTADQTVKKGTVIKVVVSMGPKTVKIPKSIIGQTYDQAVFELMKMGFDYDNIVKLEDHSSTDTYGTVIEITPAVSANADRDSVVVLRVSANQQTDNDTSSGASTPETVE